MSALPFIPIYTLGSPDFHDSHLKEKMAVKPLISQEWCQRGKNYSTYESLAQYIICSFFHLCIPQSAWYFTGIYGALKWVCMPSMWCPAPHPPSFRPPWGRTQDTGQYGGGERSKPFQGTNRWGDRVPLLFLLTHGTWSEEMYEPSQGKEGGSWRQWRPYCRLWHLGSRSLWAPPHFFPLLWLITSIP